MTSSPLVSAVITTYNRKKLLIESIKSVLQQTYKNIEIIVVNDGGDKNIEQLINSNINSNSIKYIYKENGGLSSARNTGIKASNGSYIAFLDDDDTWYNNKIELQLNKIGNNSNYALCTSGVRVNYLLNGMHYYNYPKITNISFDGMLLRNLIGISSCVLIKREVFDEIGYYDERLPAREDYDFHIRVVRKFKVTYVNKPLVNYTIHQNPNKQMNGGTEKFKIANDILFEKYKDYYDSFDKSLLNIKYSDLYFQYSTICINNNLKISAIKFIIKAISKNFNIKHCIVLISYLFGLRAYILLKKTLSLLIKIKPNLK